MPFKVRYHITAVTVSVSSFLIIYLNHHSLSSFILSTIEVTPIITLTSSFLSFIFYRHYTHPSKRSRSRKCRTLFNFPVDRATTRRQFCYLSKIITIMTFILSLLQLCFQISCNTRLTPLLKTVTRRPPATRSGDHLHTAA